ncbi:hypothetical protein QQF64_034069 [Cirrhinus molitorella]|uniref:Uncharacterized protein n=1 Tax=Cirrhinus molitorella TaxID=172907 RepID=A0ABR3MVL7_9TELE
MLRGQMPSEFARQPRGLQELDRWKATEFRQFLLYTGPIVLKNTVSSQLCSLNDICCFPYENYLQQIKRLVRTGQNPLEQVSKRLVEIEHAQGNSSAQPKAKPQMYISSKRRDSCFLLEDESFAFVQERRGDGTAVCDVVKHRHTVDLFDKPCPSKLLNIAYIGNGRRFRRKEVKEKDLNRKVACLPFNNGSVMIPLLHGIEHSC